MSDQDLKIYGTNLSMPRMYHFNYLNYDSLIKSDSPHQFKPLATWRLLLKRNFNILSSNQYVPNYMNELNSIDSIIDSSYCQVNNQIPKLSERSLKKKLKKVIQNNEKDMKLLNQNNNSKQINLKMDFKKGQQTEIAEKFSKLSIDSKIDSKLKNQKFISKINQVNKYNKSIEKFDSTLYEKNKRILPSPQLDYETKDTNYRSENDKQNLNIINTYNADNKKTIDSIKKMILPPISKSENDFNMSIVVNIKQANGNKVNQHNKKDDWSDYFELIKNRKLKLIDENTDKYKNINNLKN